MNIRNKIKTIFIYGFLHSLIFIFSINFLFSEEDDKINNEENILEKNNDKLKENVINKEKLQKINYNAHNKKISSIKYENIIYNNDIDIKTNSSNNEEIKNHKKYFIVRKIFISGNTDYNKEFIKNIIKIKIGDKINYNDINDIKKNLLNKNIFCDFLLKKEKYSNDKFEIYIKLNDIIHVDKIIVIDDKKNNKIINILNNIIYNIINNNNVSQNFIKTAEYYITKFYEYQGYSNVQISYNIKHENNNNILYFTINKGNKIEIKEIIFSGNKTVDDKTLLNIIKKKNNNIKHPKITFVRENLEEDLIKIKNLYGSFGFINTKINIYPVWKKYYGNYVMKINIDEGNKYYLDKINIIGNRNINKKLVEKILFYKKGDIYNKIDIHKRLLKIEKNSLINTYLNNGYIKAKIILIEKEHDNQKIELDIIIHEDTVVSIRNIKIIGNDITKSNIIYKYLKINKGDIFSLEKVQNSLHSLEDIGIFDNVSFKILYNIHNKEIVDINFYVKEKCFNEFNFSGKRETGNSLTDIVGNLQFKINNFSINDLLKFKNWNPIPQGSGQKLIFFGKLGKKLKSIGATFIEPFFNNDVNNKSIFKLYTNFSNIINENLFLNKNLNNKILEKQYSVSANLLQPIKLIDKYSLLSASINGNKKISILLNNEYKKYNEIYKLNDISCTLGFLRNTIQNVVYPKSGTDINIFTIFTPPYSIFYNKKDKMITQNYNQLEFNKYMLKDRKSIIQEKNEIPIIIQKQENNKNFYNTLWNEFIKCKIHADWYNKIKYNLILKLGGEIGYITKFNNSKYPLLTSQKFYMNEDLNQSENQNNYIKNSQYNHLDNKNNGTVYKKISAELRKMIYESNQHKIWITSFLKGINFGNSLYNTLKTVKMNKSIGIGLRYFLNYFGITFGINLSYPIDTIKNNGNNSFMSKLRLSFFTEHY